ncbi:hypothetical protein [Georgenia faecalis]|uniref:hypothetical protein n=1 Tax=Georgenia faecalis TaxID=2483799 RepID=UPI000FD8EDD5|nr:hypothetical protein [Georgenia faecalis]
MPVDNATLTRDLADLGARYDRAPGGPVDPAAVVFSGFPETEVRLGTEEDTVTVGTNVTFDVPRAHTLAVAEALLNGRGVYLRRPRGIQALLGTVSRALGSGWDANLVVEVPGATYEANVPFPVESFYAWLAALPTRSQ